MSNTQIPNPFITNTNNTLIVNSQLTLLANGTYSLYSNNEAISSPFTVLNYNNNIQNQFGSGFYAITTDTNGNIYIINSSYNNEKIAFIYKQNIKTSFLQNYTINTPPITINVFANVCIDNNNNLWWIFINGNTTSYIYNFQISLNTPLLYIYQLSSIPSGYLFYNILFDNIHNCFFISGNNGNDSTIIQSFPNTQIPTDYYDGNTHTTINTITSLSAILITDNNYSSLTSIINKLCDTIYITDGITNIYSYKINSSLSLTNNGIFIQINNSNIFSMDTSYEKYLYVYSKIPDNIYVINDKGQNIYTLYNVTKNGQLTYISINYNSLGIEYIYFSNLNNNYYNYQKQLIYTINDIVFNNSGNYTLAVYPYQNPSITFDFTVYTNIQVATTSITTNPNPIVLLQPATITIPLINTNSMYITNNNFQLINNLNEVVSNTFTLTNTAIIFTNVIIPYGGNNIIYLYDATLLSIITQFNINTAGICFKEGTKIKCLLDKKTEKYISIENIKPSYYAIVNINGKDYYKKIVMLVKSKLINSCEKTINKLYKLPKNADANLIEDLYITGSHSLLHNNLTEIQHEKMEKLAYYYNKYDIKVINEYKLNSIAIKKIKNETKLNNDFQLVLHNKYKLIAYFDERFEEVNDNAIFNIYHIVLEHKSKYESFAIYANGILAESTSMASIERFPMYEKLYFIDDVNTQHKKEKLRGMLLLENNIKSTKNIILTNENADDKPMLIKQNRFKIIPAIKTAKYHTKNNTRNTTQKYNTKLKRTLHMDLLLTD